MNGHLLRALLALYPRAWRDRYGAELASLTEEMVSAGEITALPAVFSLAAGAALERGRVLAGSRRAAGSAALVAVMAVAAGLCLASPVRPQGTPASARGVAEHAVAGAPAAVARAGPAPSPVPVSTPAPGQQEDGLRALSPVVTMCAPGSCGPVTSPVAVSAASMAQEHGQ